MSFECFGYWGDCGGECWDIVLVSFWFFGGVMSGLVICYRGILFGDRDGGGYGVRRYYWCWGCLMGVVFCEYEFCFFGLDFFGFGVDLFVGGFVGWLVEGLIVVCVVVSRCCS